MQNKTKQKRHKLQHKSISINPDDTKCYTKNKSRQKITFMFKI